MKKYRMINRQGEIEVLKGNSYDGVSFCSGRECLKYINNLENDGYSFKTYTCDGMTTDHNIFKQRMTNN